MEVSTTSVLSPRRNIYLPTLSLFGLPYKETFKRIREAGFNGAEVLVNGWNRHRLGKITGMAREAGLEVTYHQPWSLDENRTHPFNHILSAIGYLPPNDYTLEWVMENIPANRRVVLYPDRIKEENIKNERCLFGGITNYYKCINMAYQTTSVLKRNGEYKMSWDDFLLDVCYRGLRPIVFDTQHVLEYSYDLKGVEELRKYSSEQLLRQLKKTWEQVGGSKDRVVEIHWNDCDPKLGHTGGRNVPLGTGILPLKEFATFLKEKDWWGTIVPEIKPSLPIPHSVEYLTRVRETVEEHFS